jgi:hypothetical protein
MQQLQSNNSNLTENYNDSNEIKMKVTDMPDPEDIFSITLGAADTSNSFVRNPNVRNNDGSIIRPHEYETKFIDGSIVMINASLKM